MKKEDKTNVCRILDQKKVEYEHLTYDPNETNGEMVAKLLGQDPARVFKTLVTVGNTKAHYVFVVPVNKELDLKKAAKAVGEKSIAMIPQKELLPLTGYIHGGCSPIGMKKLFKTTIDESASLYDQIYFSAGKVGNQVKVAPSGLAKVIAYELADIVKE